MVVTSLGGVFDLLDDFFLVAVAVVFVVVLFFLGLDVFLCGGGFCSQTPVWQMQDVCAVDVSCDMVDVIWIQLTEPGVQQCRW